MNKRDPHVATNDELKIAQGRMALYRFLMRLYGREPDLNLLQQIREPDFVNALLGLGIEFDERTLLETEKGRLLEGLITEYTRLFIGPGKHISPHESVHREKERRLWGDLTVKVRAFIKATGLEYSSDFKGIPDHISVELEFMYRLVGAEIEACKSNDRTAVDNARSFQRLFLEEHISQWVPQFSDMVSKETRLDFYRTVAELTKAFIVFETECLGRD